MNKKIAVAVMGLMVACAGSSRAAQYVTGNLVNENGLAYNNTYTMNVSTWGGPQLGVGRVAVQIIYSSMTPAVASFNGGTTSTATIAVLNNGALSGNSATNQITVPLTSQILAQAATAQITVSSGVPGAVVTINGNTLREGIEWVGINMSSHSACVNLSVAINTYLASTMVSTCPLVSGVIYTTATASGVAGNSYTVISSTPFGISTGTLSFPFNGGRPGALFNQWIEFNGDRAYNGFFWTDASGTSTGTAISIANWLNSQGIIRVSTGVSGSNGVVFATATTMGVAGNAFTLRASTTNLVIPALNFSFGRDTASITLNGTVLSAGVQGSGSWAIGATAGATAINISSAIMNTPATASIVVSTTLGAGTIVFTTSTQVGTAANYTLTSSTPAALSVSNNRYFGGTNSAYTRGSAVINVNNHGYTTGLAVYHSTGSAVQLLPLVWGTTYFAIVVDANNFALATSLVNAVAGSSITITSSSTLTTAPTFTETPLTIAGSVSWKWQVSNDNLNWTDLTTPPTYTVGTTYVFPSTSTVIDFGDVDYLNLRMNITAPTAGGLKIKVPVNGRQ